MFILARMREEYDRTGSTSQAAVRGIASTGRLVTNAALILFLSFVAMARARDRHQDPRHRTRRRDPAGRDDRPRAAGPRASVAVRPLELVAARQASPAAAGDAYPCETEARASGCQRALNGLPPCTEHQAISVRRASGSCRGCLQQRLVVCLKDRQRRPSGVSRLRHASTPKQV